MTPLGRMIPLLVVCLLAAGGAGAAGAGAEGGWAGAEAGGAAGAGAGGGGSAGAGAGGAGSTGLVMVEGAGSSPADSSSGATHHRRAPPPPPGLHKPAALAPVLFEPSYEWREVGASVPAGMEIRMPLDGSHLKTARIPPTWQLRVRIPGRGLHSSTSQLNLSRICHKKSRYTP